jgi:hypothetical protein
MLHRKAATTNLSSAKRASGYGVRAGLGRTAGNRTRKSKREPVTGAGGVAHGLLVKFSDKRRRSDQN